MQTTIVADTREQRPYDFSFYAEADVEVVTQKVDYGDYTILGLEDKITIERKATTAEVANNVGKDKDRFYREMEALKSFDHAVFLCEFSLENVYEFPKNSGIPAFRRKYIRINGKYIAKCLHELEEKYGIQVIYAGDANKAEEWAYNFLTEKAKEYAGNLSNVVSER